jgi:hypothetical protein
LEGFHTACTIEADLSGLYPLLQENNNQNGEKYWNVNYQIGVQFGGTELKALLQWKEKVSFQSSVDWIRLADFNLTKGKDLSLSGPRSSRFHLELFDKSIYVRIKQLPRGALDVIWTV